MRKNLKQEAGFVCLICLLFALVIIGFLISKYWSTSSSLKKDPQTEKMLNSSGIDTSTPQSLLSSTKAKIHGLEKMELQREEQVFNSIEH